MRQLNGVFTQASNRRHARTGHLFQGRFKGILADKDAKRDPQRNDAIVAAYATGAFSYREIGEFFGLHFATVGRIIRQAMLQGENPFPGDGRLNTKLRREELLPLGSRIRTRLAMEYASREELTACLNHLLASAGNAQLMTPELTAALCDHAFGNYRVLTAMAGELLATAAQRELTQLDERLLLELYATAASKSRKRA